MSKATLVFRILGSVTSILTLYAHINLLYTYLSPFDSLSGKFAAVIFLLSSPLLIGLFTGAFYWLGILFSVLAIPSFLAGAIDKTIAKYTAIGSLLLFMGLLNFYCIAEFVFTSGKNPSYGTTLMNKTIETALFTLPFFLVSICVVIYKYIIEKS